MTGSLSSEEIVHTVDWHRYTDRTDVVSWETMYQL